ncbi:MAG: putative toxin-antitoxin system toxin component, PIN family [Nitrospirae bacterium]|nr:putative toxin-antitoxin system toxin component, PIN family [Nitrospirota bacterium]
MRYSIFLDTNILISGIFFEGNESKILDLVEIELLTSDDVVNELYEVINKKLKYLKERSLEIALLEVNRALADIQIIYRTVYSRKIKEAEGLITHKRDAPILAAVLSVKPDYFLTGDSHFFNEKIKDIVTVVTAKDFLEEIKKK